MRLKLLDLFCKAGGTSMGYYRAGFDVTGVDIKPQKRYPFRFVLGDALEYLEAHWREYDVIAASPPCQRFSQQSVCNPNLDYPDFISPLRHILSYTNKPYIIENVPRAPLKNPVMLCGSMFGLKVYRHRIFESSLSIQVPTHHSHNDNTPKAGRGTKSDKGFMSVTGHFADVEYAKEAMGISWMVGDELREAIPPAYTEYIGKQVISALTNLAPLHPG